MENPKLIIAREDYFELHFADKVEYWNIVGEKIGESEVHKYGA